MTEKVFIREAFVNLHDLDFNNLACPHCFKIEGISLSGYTMTPREEIYEDNHVTVREAQDNQTFNLRQIFCMNCNTKSFVIDDLIFNLQKSNAELLEVIQKLSGKNSLVN